MDQILNEYLEKVNRYLKPMPVSERVDIVNDIKGTIMELQSAGGLPPHQVIERLGNPKELAKAYAGESISKGNSYSLKKIGSVIAFYSLTGLSGMFVLPCASVLSVGLLICSVIAPIGGLIKLGGYLFGYDLPFGFFQFGPVSLHPLLQLPASVLFAALFYFCGKGLWKLTIKYIQTVSRKKKELDEK